MKPAKPPPASARLSKSDADEEISAAETIDGFDFKALRAAALDCFSSSLSLGLPRPLTTLVISGFVT